MRRDIPLPDGVPRRITVLGETLLAVEVRTDIHPEAPIMVYRNLSAGTKAEQRYRHSADLKDWIEWSR